MALLPRKRISPRNLALLERDLSYGAPVLYRRVPGPGRRYYDPKRPEMDPVTEDYYLRVYKPALAKGVTLRPGTPEQRIYTPTEGATVAFEKATERRRLQQLSLRSDLRKTWLARRKFEGNPLGQTKRQANADFEYLVRRLRIASYQARHQNRLENDQRRAAFSQGSEYSNLLIALGRRTGLETWPIGESPLHVNNTGDSYIDTVVLPALNRR